MGSDTHLHSGNASGMRRTGRPEPSHGVRVAARWGSGRMGRGAHTVEYGVRADPGCARRSRDQRYRKCRRNGFRGLGGLGSCGELDRVFDPARRRADAGGPTAGRSPRRCPRRSGCIAARRGFGCHLLQPRRLARRMRWRHRVVGDSQHPRRPNAPAAARGRLTPAPLVQPPAFCRPTWRAIADGLGPREEWGSVPIAATCQAADHRHHDHHCPDLADRRSLPFRERRPSSGWRVV